MEEKTLQKISNQDEKIISLFRIINPDSEKIVSLVKDLSNFNQEFASMENITNFLTDDNIYILSSLNYRDNIKINLLLVKIFINIINNQSLYMNYLVEYTEEKLHLVLQIFEECITLIQKMSGFILEPEIFELKEKTLSLIKCIYFNWKGRISNLAVTQKLEEYLDTLPEIFYSETFNKFNTEKESLNILNTIDKEKIKNFEDNFQQINCYFEQLEVFKKFVKMNLGKEYNPIIGEKVEEEKKVESSGINKDKIDFYQEYGSLLLKFCKYHHYIFLNQKNDEKDENENLVITEEKESANTRVIFLLDKIKEYNEEGNQIKNNEENVNKEGEKYIEKEKDSKNVVELMDHKSFISINECQEYNDLIKKGINKYLEVTKEYENDSRLKSTIEQLNYFISSITNESYVPLYLSEFGKISIIDNFTPFFMINVPAGKTNEFYLETKSNETMLVFIEFYLENNSKDINFEINKYEIFSNEFKNIFKEEKVEKKFKLFLLCSGYSLYQIIFDNYYSWFTSKDINYKITLLKMDEKQEDENDMDENKDEAKNEIKEENKDDKNNKNLFKCDVNGQKMAFNFENICQKIKSAMEKKDENVINIPTLLYFNSLRILHFNGEKYSIKEYKNEEEEEPITQLFFGYKMKHYLSKVLKLKPSECQDKTITIPIFSQNRGIFNKEISEKIMSLKNSPDNSEKINYLRKIGFIPSEEIEGGFKVKYKLYDLCIQSLVYYLFSLKNNGKEIKEPILFILFDKKVINAALFNDCAITTKIKAKNINLSKINVNEEFLKNISSIYKYIKIVFSCFDYQDEEKKELGELIEKLKKYCEDEIKVNVDICDENQIICNVFNYMNLFYDN